jgi:multicomponent K+:H+ antiporter subunit D
MEQAPAHLVIAPILIPLLAGAFMLFFDDRERRVKLALALASIGASAIAAILLLLRVQASGQEAAILYLLGNWPAPFAINLVADRLASILLVVTGLLALPAVIFASERWERAGPHFHSLSQFLLVGINGSFLTGDLFNLFVFFEVLLAASYGLVLHGGGAIRVRAGLHYIAVNLVASFIFLLGIAMVFGATGSLNLADIAGRAASLEGFPRSAFHAGIATIAIAFLVKAGMWPFSHWLVPAYSASAGPVAAIFAILSKVGIYALFRIALVIPGEDAGPAQAIIFAGGVATLILSCIGVLAAQSLKRASAYFVLMSAGTLLATLGTGNPDSTASALYYLVSSTLAVGAFFMVVELLEREQDAASDILAVTFEAYGEGEADPEDELESVRSMPGAVAILGTGFGLIALVLIGLPPLSGFLAKFAILDSILGPDTAHLRGNVMNVLLAALLVISGFVALTALARMGIRTFWAPVETFSPRIGIREGAPILFLLVTLIGLAVLAGPAMDLMTATAADLHHVGKYADAALGAEQMAPAGGEE